MAKWKSGRVDRMRVKESKDPYLRIEKLPGGAFCKKCDAMVQEGRWTWDVPAEKGVETLCPACRRIEDKYPAGYLELEGPFLSENREEIMNLVRNVAQVERNDHPMERIMVIRKDGGTTHITTTGVHIARRLGDSLKRAYQGDLKIDYKDGEKGIRVSWSR
jgi:hypothetical protein